MNPANDPFVACGKAGRPIEHGTVVDAHCHLGENSQWSMLDAGVDGLVREMDRLGIDVAAVSSLPACLGGLHVGNDEIIEAVRQHPKRFIGYMAVNPGYPDETRDELQRCFDAGLRAVKIHDCIGIPYEDNRWDGVCEFAEERALPVLAHAWDRNLKALEPRFRQWPNVRWILAHTGAWDLKLAVRLGREYANVFLETCHSQCRSGVFETLVAEGLTEKVLWGSDANFQGFASQLGRVLFAAIPPEAKQAILGANAARVLPMPK